LKEYHPDWRKTILTVIKLEPKQKCVKKISYFFATSNTPCIDASIPRTCRRIQVYNYQVKHNIPAQAVSSNQQDPINGKEDWKLDRKITAWCMPSKIIIFSPNLSSKTLFQARNNTLIKSSICKQCVYTKWIMIINSWNDLKMLTRYYKHSLGAERSF